MPNKVMLCTLCPRRCGAARDETRGEGRCRQPALPVVARAALHRWEEPVISGKGGAGTVFFSGCSLDCVFCQNDPISHRDFGKIVTVERLAEIFRELEAQGAENIDLVNPTHFAHVLPKAIKESGVSVPFVWNSGGYDRVEVIRALSPYIQVWLPDLKYLTPARAAKYSGAADYPQAATAAILEMAACSGPAVTENGLLKRGVLIRHLLLPGGLPEAKAVMDWVAEHFPHGEVLFSLMGQYIPCGDLSACPELSRTVRPSELRHAVDYMEALGLAGFTQDAASADAEYIPSFDLTGV